MRTLAPRGLGQVSPAYDSRTTPAVVVARVRRVARMITEER